MIDSIQLKYPVLCLVFSLNLSLFAQDSYEFKMALPPNGQIVKTVSTSLYGSYKNEETGTVFLFNEEGISMISIINSFITKEQVRESSKYQVRNGYLFGVVDGDSLPCIFEEDKYFFGIKQKTTLNSGQTKAVLKKISETSYIINFIEGSGYTPSMITFKDNQLFLKHFDYPSETDVFSQIQSKEELKGKAYNTQLLNPTQKEWEALDKKIIFDHENLFVKQTN